MGHLSLFYTEPLILGSYDMVKIPFSRFFSCSGESLIFGTECGNLHLYSSSLEACRFNHNSIPTEFASNLADGLRVADLNANTEEDFDLPISGSYALAKAAGRFVLKSYPITDQFMNESIS